MVPRDLDMQVRLAAFAYLKELVQSHGEVLPASVLRVGFIYQGKQVGLKGVQGAACMSCNFRLREVDVMADWHYPPPAIGPPAP